MAHVMAERSVIRHKSVSAARAAARSQLVLRLAVLGVIVLLWQAAGNDEIRLAMPTFTRTMTALWDLLQDGSLLRGLLETNQALVGGFALALLVSLPLGLVMGIVPGVERVSQPYLTILLAVPMIALVPVIQVAFGLTLTAKVVIVFMFAFVYMTVNVMVGVQSVDPSLREMGKSYGASRWNLLRYVVLPTAVPAMMAGVRLGLGRCMIGMVVAELRLVGAGVGSLIRDYQIRFEPAYVLAIVLVVLVEGVILIAIAKRLEDRLSGWRGEPSYE